MNLMLERINMKYIKTYESIKVDFDDWDFDEEDEDGEIIGNKYFTEFLKDEGVYYSYIDAVKICNHGGVKLVTISDINKYIRRKCDQRSGTLYGVINFTLDFGCARRKYQGGGTPPKWSNYNTKWNNQSGTSRFKLELTESINVDFDDWDDEEEEIRKMGVDYHHIKIDWKNKISVKPIKLTAKHKNRGRYTESIFLETDDGVVEIGLTTFIKNRVLTLDGTEGKEIINRIDNNFIDFYVHYENVELLNELLDYITYSLNTKKNESNVIDFDDWDEEENDGGLSIGDSVKFVIDGKLQGGARKTNTYGKSIHIPLFDANGIPNGLLLHGGIYVPYDYKAEIVGEYDYNGDEYYVVRYNDINGKFTQLGFIKKYITHAS